MSVCDAHARVESADVATGDLVADGVVDGDEVGLWERQSEGIHGQLHDELAIRSGGEDGRVVHGEKLGVLKDGGVDAVHTTFRLDEQLEQTVDDEGDQVGQQRECRKVDADLRAPAVILHDEVEVRREPMDAPRVAGPLDDGMSGGVAAALRPLLARLLGEALHPVRQCLQVRHVDQRTWDGDDGVLVEMTTADARVHDAGGADDGGGWCRRARRRGESEVSERVLVCASTGSVCPAAARVGGGYLSARKKCW